MLNELNGFPAVFGRENGEIFALQVPFKQESAYCIVFSDQNGEREC
jgi:hypothetical protein